MKTHLFKRGIAGLLSLVMCLSAFIGLGTTTAFAAGEQAEVYLISFPRNGDTNLDYSGKWGHPEFQFMNGWFLGASNFTIIRALNSYDGNICYCMRQFIFSACACVVAVGLYFLLKPYVGRETVSWMCILGAAPFAALGFIKYNGMTAEKFVWAWFKSEFLMPKKLTFRSTNTYYEMMKPEMEHKQKEVLKAND